MLLNSFYLKLFVFVHEVQFWFEKGFAISVILLDKYCDLSTLQNLLDLCFHS